jgi:uncharacterized Zn-finger protein
VSQLRIEDDLSPYHHQEDDKMDEKDDNVTVSAASEGSCGQLQSLERLSSAEESLSADSNLSPDLAHQDSSHSSLSERQLTSPHQEPQQLPSSLPSRPPAIQREGVSCKSTTLSATDVPHNSQQAQVPLGIRANESLGQGTQPLSTSQPSHRLSRLESLALTASAVASSSSHVRNEEEEEEEETSPSFENHPLGGDSALLPPSGLSSALKKDKEKMDPSEIPPEFLPLKRHVCSFQGCYKSFHRKSDLIRHERIHVNDRPHACTWPECGKRFGQKHALKVHYR